LAFIGWQLYKPKPPPPPKVPLHRAGYRMIEIPGPDFKAGDKLVIRIKEGVGRVFWAGPNEYTAGRELFSATWPVLNSSPLQLWVQGNAPVIIGYVPREGKKHKLKYYTL